MKIDYLSNSSMERFSTCPLSYYHQYLNPDKPEQQNTVSYYAEYGTLLHFLAEMYPKTNYFPDKLEFKETKSEELFHKHLNVIAEAVVDSKEGLRTKDCLDIFNDMFDLINFPDKKTMNIYYEQGIKFVESLVKRDWSKVISLEQEFNIQLEGLPTIKGFIDKIERDDKGIIITDYKTSKPYTEDAISKKKQLPIYGMASWFLYGELPYKYRYDFIRYNKVVEVEIPKEQLTKVRKQIEFLNMSLQSYIKENKFPAKYDGFYCSRFCGFSHVCETYQLYNDYDVD